MPYVFASGCTCRSVDYKFTLLDVAVANDSQDSCPMCHEKLYQTDATSQTEEVEEEVVRQVVEAIGEEEEEEQDINQNYLEEESDDYIDITDSEELEE